ncbi:hypothetical protein F4693_000136 [Sphingomonas endophytica]|uniref:Uncharacterized protein n=1 Tax=Sphingomonas endophytica TaxID=869719 RepID=A0A7X0JAU5_9SPHN|nr:hypothetical protein [Sphingomonas endophytica]MBB6503187.1 hypothetical protein [Sphingomonas endophytica]
MSSPAAYANIVFFYVAQSFVSAHAFIRGGGPERAAGGALLLAALSWSFVQLIWAVKFNHVAWTLALIDLALLIAILIIVAFADRFWPIWLASLQIVAVANHGVRAYDPAIIGYAYWLVAGKLSYPMLAILFIGTRRHQQRLSSGHMEFSWTAQRRRS